MSLAPALVLLSRKVVACAGLVCLLSLCTSIPAHGNVLLPPGLSKNWTNSVTPRNNTLLEVIHKELLKKRIEDLLRKYRSTENDTTQPVTPTAGHPYYVKPDSVSRTQLELALFQSKASGRKKLQFQLRSNDTNAENIVKRASLWVHIAKPDKKKKKKKKKKELRKRKKGKRVRISVYSVNQATRKEEIIAELRTRVEETKWYRISLPISVVNRVQQSVNRRLVLRLKCKKCNKRTRLILPQTMGKNCIGDNRRNSGSSKAKRGKGRFQRAAGKRGRKRKNKNRTACKSMRTANIGLKPFIVIEKRAKDNDRLRRSAGSACPASNQATDAGVGSNGNLNGNRSQTSSRRGSNTNGIDSCCAAPTYVEFSDLGLEDTIVAPSGFRTGQCFGECPRKRRGRQARQSQRRNRRRRRRNKNRRNRCRPFDTSPLTVLLFNDAHDLIEAELQNVVVETCRCR